MNIFGENGRLQKVILALLTAANFKLSAVEEDNALGREIISGPRFDLQ